MSPSRPIGRRRSAAGSDTSAAGLTPAVPPVAPVAGSTGTGGARPSGRTSAGKGRPTPKRSQAQGGHRRHAPTAPPPQTRKEAAQRAREEAKEARADVRSGARMLPRDAGPVRALVRDVIDGRRNIGVLMLPLALILVLAQATGSRRALDLALVVWIFGVVALFTDLVLTTVVLRRRIRAEHPEVDRTRGHVAYGLLRSTVFRPWRIPAARVSAGRARS